MNDNGHDNKTLTFEPMLDLQASRRASGRCRGVDQSRDGDCGA